MIEAAREIYARYIESTAEGGPNAVTDAIRAGSKDDSHGVRIALAALSTVADEMPDDIDLFRTLRAAGRSDAAKARGILASLPKLA